MSVNKYNGTNLIRVAGKGKKGDAPDVMIGATSTTDGAIGSVPQPMAGDEDKVLKGNGEWGSAAADDNFVGTLSQWNALSLAEQIKYKTADIMDDFNGSPIDSALSDTSSNPVQNRIIKAAIDNINNNAVSVAMITIPVSALINSQVTAKGFAKLLWDSNITSYLPNGYKRFYGASPLYINDSVVCVNIQGSATGFYLNVRNITDSDITLTSDVKLLVFYNI